MVIQDFPLNSGRSLNTGNMVTVLNDSENSLILLNGKLQLLWVPEADALKINMSMTYSNTLCLTYNLVRKQEMSFTNSLTTEGHYKKKRLYKEKAEGSSEM